MNLIEYFVKHKDAKNIVNNIKSGMGNGGYLLYSDDSQSNIEFCKAVAMGILCDGDSNDNCANCLKVKKGSHPDLLVYPKEKNFSVIDAKEIVEYANIKPMICDKKVFVINNFELASEESQNKLLKTIEEPPTNVFFLINASSLDKVLPTIKSRLNKVELKPFEKSELEFVLSEYKNRECFDLAISLGDGYCGKTLKIIENPNFLEYYNLAKRVAFELKSSSEVINFVPQKIEQESFLTLIESLSLIFRDMLMIKSGKDNLVKNVQIKNDLISVSNEYSVLALTNILKLIDKANEKQFSNVSLVLILETLFVNILEVKFLCK